ncbi:MAG: prepilin-type N-terminal cleavage/methylation domain-containing protein [Mariprofundaceae bacterium]|nr:prepilin-type N-terminal cleavage/methylation domain-containing protein [Mariprofundaceae bacterium]
MFHCDSLKDAGFTLIEVLVASAIVIATIMTVFQMFSSGLWNMKRAGRVAHLMLVEKQLITELKITKLQTVAEDRGEIEGISFHWKATEKDRRSTGSGVFIRYDIAILLSPPSAKEKHLSFIQIRKSIVSR